jgi:hypothetical protein
MITDAPLEGGYVFVFYLGKKMLDLLTYIFSQVPHQPELWLKANHWVLAIVY